MFVLLCELNWTEHHDFYCHQGVGCWYYQLREYTLVFVLWVQDTRSKLCKQQHLQCKIVWLFGFKKKLLFWTRQHQHTNLFVCLKKKNKTAAAALYKLQRDEEEEAATSRRRGSRPRSKCLKWGVIKWRLIGDSMTEFGFFFFVDRKKVFFLRGWNITNRSDKKKDGWNSSTLQKPKHVWRIFIFHSGLICWTKKKNN